MKELIERRSTLGLLLCIMHVSYLQQVHLTYILSIEDLSHNLIFVPHFKAEMYNEPYKTVIITASVNFTAYGPSESLR